MDILQEKESWTENFRNGWLAHYRQTGEVDWKLYSYPKNEAIPGAPGVRLAESRLMFVTSSGAYLAGSLEPFDAASQVGDYSLRRLPADVSFASLAYAHDHFDHTNVEADPRTALPLPQLRRKVADGEIGSLAPTIVSFMGYQPDSARVVDELIPPIVEIARQENVQAALLAPV